MFRIIASTILSSLTVLSLVFSQCHSMLPSRPTSAGYDYSQPVPASEQRGDNWFDGSAFIGHSLIEGFEMFSDIDSNIHYFSTTGLSAAGVTGYSQFTLPNGDTGTLKAGLNQKQFSKIYVMLGVNEISTSKESFKKNMSSLVELIRANQPEGIPIYILELTPTTKAKSDATVFSLANVQKLNEALAELCQKQECYLVDLCACFAGADGYLPSEQSTDGIHLKAPQYRVMADYILSHTVEETKP